MIANWSMIDYRTRLMGELATKNPLKGIFLFPCIAIYLMLSTIALKAVVSLTASSAKILRSRAIFFCFMPLMSWL